MENKMIVRVNYSHLRNEAYVEMHDTIKRIFINHPPAQLGITPQYDLYQSCYSEVVAALDVIFKSGYTGLLDEQDHVRDRIFRGLDDAVKSALNHFSSDKREAARMLKIVLDRYGNIAAKAIDQETAAIDDLIRELQTGNYPAMTVTLALTDWIEQLQTENRRFKDLMMARYSEAAQRPATHMKTARAATDRAFRELIRQLEALALVNGIKEYETLFRELNAVLERYKNLLARKKSEPRAAANNEN
jgi:enamine deaminase RidA (YjgF/YER057c/UK114 family)